MVEQIRFSTMKHQEVCLNAYGTTAVLLLPLADERRAEECWIAKRRSGSPERNARNHYQITF